MARKQVGSAPSNALDAATKGYVDGRALTLVGSWSGLDSLSQNNAQVGLVNDSGFNLGTATGISKYNSWLGGDVWYVSNATYSTGEVTAQVQQAWIPNLDGTLDEIRRTRTNGGTWGSWAIYTPSGGSGIAPSIIDAKGDLIAGTANDTPARLAVGSDGHALVAASSETPGMQWAPANRYVGINAQTGTTYGPVLADEGKLVTLTNSGAITVTMPQDSSVAIPIGGSIDFVVRGTGMATFVAGTGVSPIEATPSAVTRAQYSGVTATKVAANTWWIAGDLA